jgi:deoxycytidylate deaminase
VDSDSDSNSGDDGLGGGEGQEIKGSAGTVYIHQQSVHSNAQGANRPSESKAPLSNYADFLNFFRGGHTIDDNLGAFTIAATLQAAMLSISIASGYLTKTKSMAIPDEFLADIFLTASGSELIQTTVDRKFCEMAGQLSKKSIAENDGKLHPYVGVVVVKDGNVIATGFRGETGKGDHGEFCALMKINADVDDVDLSGCTVYTTLEPCFGRHSPRPFGFSSSATG